MANNTRKVNLLQTAYNVSATVAAALIQAGQLEKAEVADFIEEVKDRTFADLSATDDAQPQEPARSYGGGGQRRSGGNSGAHDPGTLEFRGGKHPGKTIAEVYASDKGYIEWSASAANPNEFMRGRCQLFLQQQGAPASA